jgi:hypothetical protein
LEALQKYEQLLGYKSAEYDIVILCTAIIMMSIQETKQNDSFKELSNEIDKVNSQNLNEWGVSVGRKDRRIYKIPSACLYGITLRGRSKWTQSNMYQLCNVEKYLIGCPFWNETLLNYADISNSEINNAEILWHSDDKLEEFYNKYFPDDIPDEWSLKDKQKSHGDGILAPSDTPTIWKYSRDRLSRYPHLAWNTTATVNTYLENMNIDNCCLEQIAVAIELKLDKGNLKKLEPVRKIKYCS